MTYFDYKLIGFKPYHVVCNTTKFLNLLVINMT